MPERIRLFLAMLALALPGALARPQAAQAGEEPRALLLLKALLSEVEKAPVAGLHAMARQVVDAAGRDEERLAAAVLEAQGASGPQARLLRGRILLNLAGDTYSSEVVELVAQVAKEGRLDQREAALALLGDPALAHARSSAAGAATEVTLAALLEPTTPAQLKLVAARSAWATGDSAAKGRVKRALAPFLSSKDEALRRAGALTLAEIGDREQAREVLLEMQGEPTLEGRLAQAFLAQEAILREREHWMRNYDRFHRENQQSAAPAEGPDGKDPLAVLREILAKILAGHMEGDNLSVADLVDAAAKGMCQAADRHTSYFTGEEFKRFHFDLSRDYGGIGAFVNFDEMNFFSIVRPIYGGPAHKLGLIAGDRILKIDGWETPRSPDKIDEIISRLKGKPGTEVAISVHRTGWQEPKEMGIVRAQVEVPSVNSILLPGAVGYLELVTFAENSAEEILRAVSELSNQGATSLIIDLRNNTGGYLQTAVQVADLFLPKDKLVVYSRSRVDAPERHYTRRGARIPEKWPVAVLVNGRTASASEILGGCLQHYGRAVLVGERTFGKGSVQQLMRLRSVPDDEFVDENKNGRPDDWEKVTRDHNGNDKFDFGGRLKLTVAYYFLPDDTNINRRYASDGRQLDRGGIAPDREVELADIPGWKWEAIFDLMKDGTLRNYVSARWEQHKDLFLKLAEGDRRDASLYPDFEAFYESLKTKLSRDDVRRWLRVAVREAASDALGKAFPGSRVLGDFQEDQQLQAAIREVLDRGGKDWREIAQYRDAFTEPSTAQAK